MVNNFQKFSPAIANCDVICSNVTIREFGADQTILIEDDNSSQVYFILEGEVKVTSFHTNGKEVWHAALSAGQTFGEMAAITDSPRSATVVTLKSSKIGILSKTHFMNALETETGVALFFLKDMVSRLQATTSHSNARIALDIPSRICAELLRQAGQASEKSDVPVAPDLTVTALAQRLNANRETVSRTISSLIDAGHIKKEGRRFFILNMEALKQRAEG